jgi:hypothetical protein
MSNLFEASFQPSLNMSRSGGAPAGGFTKSDTDASCARPERCGRDPLCGDIVDGSATLTTSSDVTLSERMLSPWIAPCPRLRLRNPPTM